MKKIVLLFTILMVLSQTTAIAQKKFVGNIHQNYNDANFTNYWNQVTPENSGKWKTCEPSRDYYNWSGMDAAYSFAKSRGLEFKQHTFVWGNQYPKWMDNLSRADQRAEVEEWIKDFGERYPDCDYIDVVNEPLHAAAPYKEALGGAGVTGWDWVVTSFEWARKYCPNAKLLLNDFDIITNTWGAGELAKIANILKSKGLIDGIGIQCHAFNMNYVTSEKMRETLAILSATGLPIYVAELDIEGDDATQLARYKEKFPILFNHENVKGITLWGYRKNNMWLPGGWLYDATTKVERPALKWLKQFIIDNEPKYRVPGRIETENYFRQHGTDTAYVNDSTVITTKINNNDWVNYALNVIADELYDVKIKVNKPKDRSKVYVFVDDVIADTIVVSNTSDTLSIPLFFTKGDHILMLKFENTTNSSSLMELDWIDIYGETNYYKINVSSDRNGSINPNGDVYVVMGDTAKFTFDAAVGFMPDSVIIDGVAQKTSPAGYTFYNVTEAHTIVAQFKPCTQIPLTPYYKINGNEFIEGTEVSVHELDTLSLKVAYNVGGRIYWMDIEETQSFENEFSIQNIQKSQKGVYQFYHINDSGCKSGINFNVSVDYVELNVFQAEDYVSQSGIQKEDTEDIGGGENIGYIQNGDWSIYELAIDSMGVYDFQTRAATDTDGGTVEISMGNKVLGSIKVEGSKTNGWQDWYTTESVELNIQTVGSRKLKLAFKGANEYLFNLNWFTLEYKRPVECNSVDLATTAKVKVNNVVVTADTIKANIGDKIEFFCNSDDNGIWVWSGKANPLERTNTLIIESLSLNDEGKYTVNFTNVCGETDMHSINLKVNATTSVTNNYISNWEMYPNPVRNYLNISSLENKPGLVTIYNLTGKQVMSQNIMDNNAIDVTPLSSGYYTIRLEYANKIYGQNFIKE